MNFSKPHSHGPVAAGAAAPGPYSIRRDPDWAAVTYVIQSQASGQNLAYVYFRDDDPAAHLGQTEAITRLLASAPQLRDALRYLVDTVADLPREYLSIDFRQAERDAHDVLAQVEGCY